MHYYLGLHVNYGELPAALLGGDSAPSGPVTTLQSGTPWAGVLQAWAANLGSVKALLGLGPAVWGPEGWGPTGYGPTGLGNQFGICQSTH